MRIPGGLAALFAMVVASGCGGVVVGAPEDAATSPDTESPAPVVDASLDVKDESVPPPVLDAGPVDTGCRPGPVETTTGTACRSDGELVALIAKACAPGVLVKYDLRDPCGATYSYRSFTCCNPDGTGCGPIRRDGDPTSCKDTATWRKYSESECATSGKVLGTITFDTPCGPGAGHLGAAFACCR